MGSKPAPLDGPGVGVSDPRELLLEYLDWYREALMRKVSGLSEEQLRTPVEPLGWSPLGLIQHLGRVERRWIRWGLDAQDLEGFPPGEWTIADDVSVDAVITAYRSEVAAAADLIAAASLTDRAKVGGRFATPEEAPSLVRILFHLLQEYARHVGHLDVARELIDGTTGE